MSDQGKEINESLPGNVIPKTIYSNGMFSIENILTGNDKRSGAASGENQRETNDVQNSKGSAERSTNEIIVPTTSDVTMFRDLSAVHPPTETYTENIFGSSGTVSSFIQAMSSLFFTNGRIDYERLYLPNNPTWQSRPLIDTPPSLAAPVSSTVFTDSVTPSILYPRALSFHEYHRDIADSTRNFPYEIGYSGLEKLRHESNRIAGG